MKIKIFLSGLLLLLITCAFGQTNKVIDSLECMIGNVVADTAEVTCLLDVSKEYKNKDIEMSMHYAELALQLATELEFRKGIALSHKFIGNCHQIKGTYTKALENFYTALKIFVEIEDKRNIGFIYTNIGIIYWYMGNLPEALENTLTALKIFKEIGDMEGMSISFNSIAGVYVSMGNYPEALENYLSSLKLSEEIGDKGGIAKAYTNIGNTHLNLGNYSEALENLLAALEISEDAGCYNNIAWIYWDQGNYHEAIKYFQASLKISKEIGYNPLTAYNYMCLVDVNIDLGNFQEAKKYLDDLLDFSNEIGDKKGIVNSYIKMGNLYHKQGNFQEARKYLDDGLALSKEIGIILQIKDSYYYLSKLDSAEGNFAQSLDNYKMFTSYKDSLLNDENEKEIAGMLIQYETEKKDREIELLNKDNEIKALQLQHQEVSLLASRLETEKNQSELVLMNNSMELQELRLGEIQKDLEYQQAEISLKEVEMELLGKDKILAEQRLEKQQFLRNGMLAGIFLIVLVGLLLFRSFWLRKKLEKQEAIVQERHRISADLHDDVGSGLSKITLLSELLKMQAKTPENRKEAEKISETALELSSTISEIIWALNSNNDYLKNMLAYIRRYAAEYFEDSPVKLKIVTQGKILPTPIDGDHRRNIFYTVKEALHNIMKHAEATEAELRFVMVDNKLDVIISDNGKGIPDLKTIRFGNGIKNMRARMKSISGYFKIEGHHGTRIILKLAV